MVHLDFGKNTTIRFTLPIEELEAVKEFLNGGNMQIWHEVLNIFVGTGIVIYFIFSHKTSYGGNVYKVYAGFDTLVENCMDLKALCLYEISDEKTLIKKIETNPNFIFEEDVFNMLYSKENLVKDLLQDYKDGVWIFD